ncbi:MAG: hypothetical protein MUC50_21885, partial [Myxococcota bacterium]|nr:hypothetical protein [Myxococcota bacterium]
MTASATAPAKGGKKKYLGPAVLLGILLIGIAAVLLLNPKEGSEPEGGNAPSPNDIKARLAELSLEPDQVVDPCDASDSVKAWVDQIGPGDGPEATEKLQTALLRAKEQGLWRPHPQREPRPSAPLSAHSLATRFMSTAKEAPYEALSYELACLLLAGGRVAKAPVRLVEVLEFDGAQSPADPDGRLGRYAVEVGQGSEAFLLDPYSGRSKASAKGRTTALDRLQEAAPYYGIAALSRLVSRQTPEALRLNDAAVALDGRSGWLRMGRGLIIAATGAIEEAMNELERSVKTQEEPPLLVDLAELQLMTDSSGRSAESSLVAALSKTPKYARAKA